MGKLNSCKFSVERPAGNFPVWKMEMKQEANFRLDRLVMWIRLIWFQA
jgi:hypothetical protein